MSSPSPSTSAAAPSTVEQRERWPLGSLVMLAAAVFVSVTTELLPTGLLPAMSQDLGVTQGRLGLIVTAYALMVAVLAAPIGMATARFDRRRLVTIAMVGYVVCNVITAVSDTYALTVAGRMVGGLSHGLFWGTLAGYAGRLVGPDRVGRAVTIASAGGPASVLVGVPLGTAVGTWVGWRPVFVGFAVVAAALAVVASRLLPPVAGSAAGTTARLRDVIRLPGMAVVVVATGLVMLGHFCFITYIAPFLTHAGVTDAQLAPALLGYGAAGLVGLVLAGLLVDRVLRAALLAATALLTATFVGLALGGTSIALAVAATAATGLALGMLPVFLQAAALHASQGAPDPASALNASAFNVGIAGGALLGGLTLDHLGAAALPLVAAGLTALGLVAMAMSRSIGALPAGAAARIV